MQGPYAGLARRRRVLFAAIVAVVALPTTLGAITFAQRKRAPSLQAAVLSRDKQVRTITHSWRSDPKWLDIQAATLGELIWWSFGLKRYQVTGPPWLGSDLFDVRASMSAPTAQTDQKKILQKVLVDCFNMKFRYDKTPRPVFLLELTPGGAKLTPSRSTEPRSDGAWTHYDATGITMPYLAQDLDQYFTRPVLDRTGLKGRYDVNFSFSAPLAAPAAIARNSGPSIFTALQQTLGLRLVPAKAPILTLKIDAASIITAHCTEPPI